MGGCTGVTIIKRNTVLVNLKTGARCDVYIGRPGPWGNPYSHEGNTQAKYKVKSRQEAVEKYEEYILQQPDLMSRLSELEGRVLGCWCVPALCHGHVLIKLINTVNEENKCTHTK